MTNAIKTYCPNIWKSTGAVQWIESAQRFAKNGHVNQVLYAVHLAFAKMAEEKKGR